MKTNELRYNQIQNLLEYQERCLLLNEKPYIDGIFGYKIVKKGKKKRKYDVILTEINDSYKCNSLIIPSIFNKIDYKILLYYGYTFIDFGNIESLPNNLCQGLDFLKEVKGSKVYNIGVSCFFSCKNLTKIDFPVLNSVHHHAFFNTSIKEFNQPKVSYIEEEVFKLNGNIKEFIVDKMIDKSKDLFSIDSLKYFKVNSMKLSTLESIFVRSYYKISSIYLNVNHAYINSLLYFDAFSFNSEKVLDAILEGFNYNIRNASHLSDSEKDILYKYSTKEIEFVRTLYNNIKSDRLKDSELEFIKNNPWIYDISNIGLSLTIYNLFFKHLKNSSNIIHINICCSYQIKRLKLMGLKNNEIKTYLQLQSKYLIGVQDEN